jgi:leucyl/phenylalanyl-tRNA--protein transferase
VGGDLSPGRLLEAYRRGIFPWYSAGQPILWWSPDPRAILLPHEFRVSRSLGKSLRNRGYATRIDTAFADVVRLCGAADVRSEGTWITPAMQAAYGALRELGYAHSVETWRDERWWGGSTASRWAISSSASRCSASSAMRRKLRSSDWSTSCRPGITR